MNDVPINETSWRNIRMGKDFKIVYYVEWDNVGNIWVIVSEQADPNEPDVIYTGRVANIYTCSKEAAEIMANALNQKEKEYNEIS